MRDLVEEYKDVLIQLFRSDIGSDSMKLIELIAEDMALSKYTLEGGIPVELRDKCYKGPLAKRLREAELW